MKTTIEIPDALFAEAKSYASARGLSLKEVVVTGLRKMLEENSGRRRRFRLRKHAFRGQGLVAEEDWPSIRRLVYEGRGE